MSSKDSIPLIEQRAATINRRFRGFPGEAGIVTRLIRHLNRLIDRNAAAALQHQDIGHTEYLILVTLYATEDYTLTRTALCQAIVKKPAEIAKAIAWLQGRGLVVQGTDGARQRRAAYCLSEAGLRALENILPIMAALMDYEKRGLTPNEMTELERLLKKLVRSLEEA